jgi:serine/threonine protein kinase/tetratricopeptide (TPR) repeat protein
MASPPEPEERLRTALADRYRIDREIGCGGMAKVYLAEDLKHGRKVAVKVMRAGLSSSLGAERFLREVQVAAGLNHPHILTLIDSGDADGALFYVMPYVEGESLRERLERESQLPLNEALQIIREVSDGLEYAHGRGVVHRDVKPENVLLSGGHSFLGDFGIARALSMTGRDLTQTGSSIGSPVYMSPEQAAGSSNPDGRSDLYSLGCMLYEMLAGEPPYSGKNPQALISKHALNPVPDVRVLRDAVPVAVSVAIQRAMSKSPADRFRSVAEFAASLGRDSPPDAPSPTERPSRRRRTRIGLAALMAIVAIGAVFLSVGDRPWMASMRREGLGVSTPRAENLSIAVLPFADLSAAGSWDYLSDGMSEEVLNLLADIPELRVTSRTSSFSFKGKDIDVRTIAERLNVSHVLEGSLRIAGDSARVSVRLVDANEDSRIWSETYHRKLADIFAIQDDIAAQVARALRATLLTEAPRSRRTDPEAYRLYLQGMHVAHQVTAENLERAIGLFRECLSADPEYVPAWDALASAYINQANSGLVTPRQGYEQARDAAQTGLRLDPRFARSYGRLGWVAMFLDGDLEAAAKHYQRGIELDPTDVFLLNGAGILAQALGRLTDAIAILRYVTARDPIFPSGHANLGIRLLYAGESDAAMSSFRTTLALAPNYVGAKFLLGMAHLQKGEAREALAAVQEEAFEPFRLIGLALVHHDLGDRLQSDDALRQLVEKHASGWAYNIAYVYAYRGEVDSAFEWLDLAVEYRDSGLADVAVQPLFANLFDDPRWSRFLERMGRSSIQLDSIEFTVPIPR